MVKKALYILIFIALTGCNSKRSAQIARKDTVDLLTIAFTTPQFYRTLNIEKDTIYVLKTKLYNKSWPAKINNKPITYIEDTEQARQVSTYIHIDNRMRYAITNFRIEEDSAIVVLNQFTSSFFIHYYLKKNTDKWSIRHVEAGMW